MEKPLTALVKLANDFGKSGYAIASGGNVSYKTADKLWISASGAWLKTLQENHLLLLSRERLASLTDKSYSSDPATREGQFQRDLAASLLEPADDLKPSVETSLHNLIDHPYLVHTHPALVNGLLCSQQAEAKTRELFGEHALFVPYGIPGYDLFHKVAAAVAEYQNQHKRDPQLVFIENHGMVAGAETAEEVQQLYHEVFDTLKNYMTRVPERKQLPLNDRLTEVLPAIRVLLAKNGLPVARLRHNTLIEQFLQGREAFKAINRPFTHDHIMACGSHFLYVDAPEDPQQILETFRQELQAYEQAYGHQPAMVFVRHIGLIAVAAHARDAEIALDSCEDLMQVRIYSENFGGPHFLSREHVAAVEGYLSAGYKPKAQKPAAQEVKHQVALVTGAAQGFGEGIARSLFARGMHVVLADLKEEKGQALARELNEQEHPNEVHFVQADVTDDSSLARAITETVAYYGGLDLLVSNAGILKAGGLDEMTPETFEAITRVNYMGYFLLMRNAAPVMKLQAQYDDSRFMDVIQINSKSGLTGSKKNFAYAGGKFGGIGLTQSFALELMPHRIKVNSICPGNFFEGPLWSDPEHGLFVQYLRAGKVPGAQTIEEVKRHYEAKVPANRGCRVEDVMKAVYYVMAQDYETGQAIPVTGGQVMLH